MVDNGLSAQDKDELEVLIAAGVERAFRDVGLNQQEVFELRKDLTFLREWRTTCDGMRTKGIFAVITLLVSGFAALVFMGYKSWVGQ